MENQIMQLLTKGQSVEMYTDDDVLQIYKRAFYRSHHEFLFVLNGKAVYGCKQPRTAGKKVKSLIDRGFTLAVD